MNLQQLTDIINTLYFNDSTSYKVISSKQKELLEIMGGDTNIKNIDYKKILNYFNYLKTKGNKPSTINTKMAYLSKCLKFAEENRLIPYKPTIPHTKIRDKKTLTINADIYNSMVSYALANKLTELYQVLIIGYNTGMRISNIILIMPEDIDKDYIRIWRNKTNNPYSIPLNNTLKEFFKTYKPFTLNYRQLQYQYSTMIKRLGLNPKITIHTLRHTTCSRLIEKGVPLPVTQALMNHKNIGTTMLYNHLKNKQLEIAVSVL